MTGNPSGRRDCREQRLFSTNAAASAARGSHPRLTSSAGFRVVHGDKELSEKLGRNDLCPCGSGRRFQEVLHAVRALRRHRT
ncbi:MAG: SEC-C metal-binding domain-containing protein [Terriglobia bacterium]